MRRLIIRPGAIGDCILSLPALEYLRATYTEIWISTPVVPLICFADRVLSIPSSGIELLGIDDLEPRPDLIRRLKSFDSIVSWYGANRPKFREAMERLDVPHVFRAALPPPDYNGHAIDFFCEQVGAPNGAVPRCSVNARSRNAIVIHPFSGSSRKNWPREQYQQLATSLPFPVEWTAGPEEALSGAVRFGNLAELASWISGARLYIGNDSGITHLAAATGVPTLALFGPTEPTKWAPRGQNVAVLHHEPITKLKIECVQEAANRLLGLL